MANGDAEQMRKSLRGLDRYNLPSSRRLLRHDCCTIEFFICLVLTILRYVPVIIYALYAVVFVDRDDYFDECRRPIYYV